MLILPELDSPNRGWFSGSCHNETMSQRTDSSAPRSFDAGQSSLCFFHFTFFVVYFPIFVVRPRRDEGRRTCCGADGAVVHPHVEVQQSGTDNVSCTGLEGGVPVSVMGARPLIRRWPGQRDPVDVN